MFEAVLLLIIGSDYFGLLAEPYFIRQNWTCIMNRLNGIMGSVDYMKKRGMEEDMQKYVESKVRDIVDFPKKGIVFRDITTAVKDPKALKFMVDFLTEQYEDKKIDYVVGIESRGFIFGAPLAYNLGAGFVVVRKPGKLPADVVSQEYSLEYGTDKIEMHADAIEEGKNVLVVDDLLATGGTVDAACKLLKKVGANIVGAAFIIELSDLKGREKLEGVDVVSMIQYKGL